MVGAGIVGLGLGLVLALAVGTRGGSTGWSPPAIARTAALTDFPLDEFDADISPDGENVVFISNREERFDVWLASTGGRGEFRNLTRDLELEAYGSGGIRVVGFSDDGAEVWFHQNIPPEQKIRILSLLVSVPGNVRPLFGDNEAAELTWAADGRVAYHAPAPGDPIYIQDGKDAEPRLLHRARNGVHQHYLQWSPNGEWIYFSRGAARTGEMDLYRIRSDDGAVPERLTEGLRDVAFPAPVDDRTVFFVARDSDGAGPWLYAIDVESHETRRVLYGVERYLSVAASADGQRLVATRANPTARLWEIPILEGEKVSEQEAMQVTLPALRALGPRFGGENLFFLSSRGARDGLWRRSGDDNVTVVLPGTEHSLLGPPAVSSDGQLVAVAEQGGDRYRLVIYSADGVRRKTPCDGIDVQSAGSWSPDGESIVVAGKTDAGPGLFRVDVESEERKSLVNEAAFNPVWSPGGDLIVYSGPQAGPFMPLLAVAPDGQPRKLPEGIGRIHFGERYRFLPPDGSALILLRKPVSNPSGEFWRFDLQTGETRPLTRLEGTDEMRSFDLTPDGKSIVFDRLSKQADVVLIDLAPRDS